MNLEGIVDAAAELSLVVAEIVGVNDTQIVEVLVVDNGGAQEKKSSRSALPRTLSALEDFLDCFLVVEAEVDGRIRGCRNRCRAGFRHHGYRAGPRTATSSWEPSIWMESQPAIDERRKGTHYGEDLALESSLQDCIVTDIEELLPFRKVKV